MMQNLQWAMDNLDGKVSVITAIAVGTPSPKGDRLRPAFALKQASSYPVTATDTCDMICPMVGTPEFPELFTPKQVAGRLGCSERTLKEVLRKHGCFRKIGQKMFLTAEDLDHLLEALKPKPKVPFVHRSKKPAVIPTAPPPSVAKKSQAEKPAVMPIKFLRTKDDPIP
jgi:hypothetical protein